ncbi:MAG: nuclear transport factor 2 family protein [Myxococcota bacterium]
MLDWELRAREQIRDLVARYNANGDSGRLDEVIALFADDATLDIDSRCYHGCTEIREMFERAAAQTQSEPGAYIQHFTATHQIDLVDEQVARGRSYFQVLTQAGLDHWGRYLDRYSQSAGSWRFQARTVHIDGRVVGGWSDRAKARLEQP